ncbi:hypothetical protein V9T40_002162 [Parthenolecanium corni]|uniref:CCHC-type domain-containing protein n=1 Tax=Parthenolecanium corni TaxID=536013 RepID=A0AAN9TK22_9HEMI
MRTLLNVLTTTTYKFLRIKTENSSIQQVESCRMLVTRSLNVLALIPKVSGSVLDSAGRQDPSYCERTPMPRKPSKLARKIARRLKFELIYPCVRLDRDPVIYEMGPLDPALIDNPTPPPSPTVEVEQFAAEVEIETEVRAAAASLNMYGRLDAGLRRVGGSEPSGSSRRRGEANLAERQTSGSAEGEVTQSHPRSSSELGLMGLWRRHRLMSLCDPPLPPSPTLPTQAGHDPLIENHDKPEPMDDLDIPMPIGPPAEANLLSLAGPPEEILVEPDIPLEAICAHVEEASVVVSAPAPAEVEEGPIVDLEEAPQPPAFVVEVEVHEPPPSARIPTPPPAMLENAPVLPPAEVDDADEVIDVVIVSDDDGEDAPVAAAPVVMLADSPPPPHVIDVVDLLADDPPAPAAALRTPPVRHRTPRGPPPAPRIPLGKRCFHCQRRGHLGNECPYPPAVGRPCFNCGLQGHEIANCPNPAPFAADNRIRLLERQQRLQERELRRLRTRRQLFSPPYSYAHPQLPPLAMWLGPQYQLPPPQPMAPLGWAYQVPRWQVPYQPPAIAYPPLPDDPEFSDPEGKILTFIYFVSYMGLIPSILNIKSKTSIWISPNVL